jgi:ADP-heptose:LPS heptosyltransferase
MLVENELKDELRMLGLGAFAAISKRLRRRPRRNGAIQRVLVIRPDHLGDLLFTTPALALLRQALPEARISYLIGPWSKAVVENNPDIDEIIPCDFPWFNRAPRASLFQPYTLLRQMARVLERYEFDVAVNLRFDFWWGAVLAHMAGIPEIIGYDRPGCQPFLTQPVPYLPRCHEVEQNLRLMSSLALHNDKLIREAYAYPLRFDPSQADDIFADQLVGRSASRGFTLAVHPGSGAAVKLWTVEGFAEVIQENLERRGGQVLITGSKSELGMAEEIASWIDDDRVRVIAGQTTVGQLGAVYRRCSLVIGCDSGPLHLAVAMHTPTVHLFGPSDAAAFGPYGDRARHAIVSADLPCIPCGRLSVPDEELPDHECMRAIETAQVLEAMDSVLGGSVHQ